jgi:hypothetical protein
VVVDSWDVGHTRKEHPVKDLLIQEWKGLAIALFVAVLGAGFFFTAARPPWNERVLSAMAEQPATARPQVPARIAQK